VPIQDIKDHKVVMEDKDHKDHKDIKVISLQDIGDPKVDKEQMLM